MLWYILWTSIIPFIRMKGVGIIEFECTFWGFGLSILWYILWTSIIPFIRMKGVGTEFEWTFSDGFISLFQECLIFVLHDVIIYST